MARILAIDYGTKKSGLAVTDPEQRIATGLACIATHQLMTYLTSYMKSEAVDLVVIGDPKQMNNSPSASKKVIDTFIAKLNEHFPALPTVLYDERFTSRMAFQSMIDSGLKKKDRRDKTLVDMISAIIILQGYMENRRMKNQ